MKKLFPFIISVLPLVFSFSTFDPVLHVRFFFFSIALSTGIIIYLFKKKRLISRTLKDPALIIYLVMIFFYVISSFYNGIVAESIFICLKVLLFYIFSILVVNLVVQYGYKRYCQSVVVFLFLLSAIYFFQFIKNHSAIDLVPSSSMANPNLLGSVIFLSLPFLIYTIIIGNRFWRRLGYLTILLAVVILIFVKSTAVFIALILSLASFLIILKRNLISRNIIKICCFLVCLFLGVFVFLGSFSNDKGINDRISQFIEYRSSSRIALYQSTFKLIKHNLFFGVGPGNWKVRCPEYGLYSDNKLDHTYYNGLNFAQRPHNDFLWVFAEAGIFAGLCYIILFLILLKKSYLLYKESVGKDRLFYLLLFSTILGYSIISMVDFPMERISHNILFFLIASIIISGAIGKRDHSRGDASVLVTFLFLIITLFSIYVGYVRYNSEIDVTSALRYKIRNNWPMVVKEINNAHSDQYYEIDNTSTPLLWYRGLAYFQQNQVERALVDFKQAYEVNPNHIHTLNNIATCYGILGDIENAKRFYNKVLVLNPPFKESRMNLAIIHFNESQYTQSLDIILQSRIDHYKLRVANKDNFDFCLKTIFKSYADSVYNYSTTEEQAILSSLIHEFDVTQTGSNVDVLQKAFKKRQDNKISYKDAVMSLY